ncbi:MAG: pilus assembly protein PilM [Candidatus Omnitrophica bacterium]|nr:pilus assembly protein PilM [Candidatus Omnitrophota bacterium]
MRPIEIFKKDYIVGLDIGSSSVKLAQFLKKEDGLHLVKAGLEEIAGNDKEESILAALKKLLRGVSIKKSKFILSINCPKTTIKKIVAPHMPKGELRNAITLAAKNYFPFTIDDALLDFEILGEVIEKGIKKYQVLVATSPKKTVNRYLSLLAKVGIKPASFIPVQYALQKLVQEAYREETGIRCFLDTGACHTELAIFSAKGGSASGGKGPSLVFSRKIPSAGSDLTKEMTGVLLSDKGKTELSLDEAEKIKREIGIPDAGESKMVHDKISTVQILSMVRIPLEHMVSEIERCFDYYREESDGGRVDSLVLFGGGALLRGIADFISEGSGIEVRLGNPLNGLKVESGAIDRSVSGTHRLGLAIGAGLSEAKGINLLPTEIKEETRQTFKRASVQAIATGIILTLVLMYIGMKIQLISFQKRTAAVNMEMASSQPQLEQVQAQDLANEILAGQPYWEDVFKELSNIVPSNIYLTGFVMKEETIKMRGIVTSSQPEELLSGLILDLENGIFKNVRLIATKEIRGKLGNEFEIECWVD